VAISKQQICTIINFEIPTPYEVRLGMTTQYNNSFGDLAIRVNQD